MNETPALVGTPREEREEPSPESGAEPPPFEIVNSGGRAPIVLLCEHAGRTLPAAYGTLGLPEDVLWRHIAWDIGAADVVRRLAVLLDAPAILSGYSRLLIDCNRWLDDPTAICRESDGVVVPGNAEVDDDERQARAARYFEPYHDAVTGVIGAKQATGTVPAVVSVHSFTPVMRGYERPWHIGVLWHKDGRLSVPLMERLRRNPALVVGDNKPYSAHEPYGYSIWRHAESTGLPHVLFEIRQDLIDTHHGAEAWANILASAIGETVRERGPFEVEHYPR